MRTKTLIEGFKNSQKFRFILTSESGENFGMYITIQEMADKFAINTARAAVWNAMMKLSYERRTAMATGNDAPTGLGCSCIGYKQVQVDLDI